ncbi:MAG: type I glutamate--ammonia ligase [Candidatus Kerfeldbacteria bacterium]|nr:type I glutamate--ammonia ligase [Candidatus Kerfeldbacteria bacterium]
MTYSPEEVSRVFSLCNERKIEMVDVKFTDLEGRWRSVTLTMSQFTPEVFTKGVAFDGSSIPGFQTIVESDLVMIPAPSTAFVDPFTIVPTLSICADPMDPVTGTLQEYSTNPRFIARKALDYLKSTGIADTMYVGPEIEFFIFDDVRYSSGDRQSGYSVDSDEGAWNTSQKKEEGNALHRVPNQRGYFTATPFDMYHNMRDEMVKELQNAGVVVERHHHEVGGPGQAEINIRFQEMLTQADQVMLYKYIVRNVAARHGKSVTFMPKPLFAHNGSGMHCHQSLWKEGKPLFYDAAGYAGLSELGRYYVGGILAHARSLLAFAAPTTNSYKRLTPGYEAPVVLAYSKRNRSAVVRVPIYDQTPAGTRIEFRSSDAVSNPYLAMSVMLLAGLDGIKNKILPPEPMDKNLFDLSAEEQKKIQFVPGSLEEALEALRNDHAYLTEGGVFSESFINNYMALKKGQMDDVRLRPHPHEFSLYYGL